MLLTVLELVFLAIGVAAIAWWSIPAAALVVSIVGVAACEYTQRQRVRRSLAPVDEIGEPR